MNNKNAHLLAFVGGTVVVALGAIGVAKLMNPSFTKELGNREQGKWERIS